MGGGQGRRQRKIALMLCATAFWTSFELRVYSRNNNKKRKQCTIIDKYT